MAGKRLNQGLNQWQNWVILAGQELSNWPLPGDLDDQSFGDGNNRRAWRPKACHDWALSALANFQQEQIQRDRYTMGFFNFSARTGLLALLLTIAPVSGPQSIAAFAEEMPVARINVTGEGHVDVAPDMAILQLGVLEEAKTARDALSANNRAMDEVINAMKNAGIEGRDLQTSNISIQPRYVHHQPKNGEEQKPPRIVGYAVSNSLTVRIRDLAKVGELLDMSVTLGVNSGGSIRFANDDPSAAISKARAQAMKDAMDRATTLVQAAGVSLGQILEINESVVNPMPTTLARGRMMAEAAMVDAVPIEGGENTYTVTVSASWKIDQ